MRSTADVIANHSKCFGALDIDGLIADYSQDAVFFGHGDVLRGPNAIRTVFEDLFVEFAKPGATIALKQRVIDGDYAYILWSAETADNFYELASDTFVVRNGSIRMQAFTAKLKPKH